MRTAGEHGPSARSNGVPAKSLAFVRRFRPGSVAIDLGFIAGLLVLCAISLILMRASARLHEPAFLVAFYSAFFGLVVLWSFIARPKRDASGPTRRDVSYASRAETTAFIISMSLLFLFVVVTFHLQVRDHFWGGGDDFASLQEYSDKLWSDSWDTQNRPLIGIPVLIARLLAPDRIEGFVYVAVAMCFANALLLAAIIRKLLPGATLIAVSAAILFVVNRSEPMLFLLTWATNFYWPALVWFQLAVYLHLVSYGRESRWLLVGSCVSLGAALLTNEAIFPLTLLMPLLVWLQRGSRERMLIWFAAWIGTVALLALRFIIHLTAPNTYQAGLFAKMQWRLMLANLGDLVSLVRTYFDKPAGLPDHLWPWLAAVALSAAAIAMVVRRSRDVDARRCLIGILLAIAAIGLGIAAFIPLATTVRTQYFAAPAQAAFVALVLALVGAMLPRRVGQAVVAGGTVLLVANATAQTWRTLEATTSLVRFEKTVHIFEQVRAVAPVLPNDALVVLAVEDRRAVVGVVNYHVVELSRALLNATAIQARFPDAYDYGALFAPNAVDFRYPRGGGLIGYDRVLAFRVFNDGTAAFLTSIPADLMDSPGVAVGYAPLARLKPAPIVQTRFLRYPRWSERAVDIFDPAEGMILGEGWGPRVQASGHAGRCATNGAELVINPAGRSAIELRAAIETAVAGQARPLQLAAIDDLDRVVAAAGLRHEAEEVKLVLPLDPDRISRFRLELRTANDGRQANGAFLVLRTDRKLAARWQTVPPPASLLHCPRMRS